MSVAAIMVVNCRSIEELTLDAIANEAGMTPQAAYRYFRDVHDLVHLGFRCIILCEHERLLARLLERSFATDQEFASAAVQLILAACENFCMMPARIANEILKEYWYICHEASWMISDLIIKGMSHKRNASAIGPLQLNAGFAASIAVAVSFVSNNRDLTTDTRARDIIEKVFISAIQDNTRLPVSM